MLGIVAAAKLIQQSGREDIVMGEGQTFVDLGRIETALQRASGLRAIGVDAGGRGRGSDLAVFIREARKNGLLIGEALVQTHIALIGGDWRREISLIVVDKRGGCALVWLGKEIVE